MTEQVTEGVEGREYHVWIFMGEGNPPRASRTATMVDTVYTLEEAQRVAKRINEVCDVARAVVQGGRICVNCADHLGSRYHEVACNPAGNLEDLAPVEFGGQR